MMPIKTTPLADYPIVNASLTRVVDTVLKRLRSGYAGCDPGMTIPETYQTGFAHITTINPLIMMGCEAKLALKKWILSSQLIVPDGVGIQWAIQSRTGVRVACITGVDLTTALLQNGGFSCMMVGASPVNYDLAMSRVTHQFPNTHFLTGFHGFYPDSEWGMIIREIQRQRPDLLLVAMGFPKQEHFLNAVSQSVTFGIGIGVGGVIDVLSGKVNRAPGWVQHARCEWLYRALREPSRVRNWPALARFVRWVYQQPRTSLSH
jgi:N-acetylglucosaminyldiphosphoundecaprenol N-acetyl-beta-D-mannosaminyltransferase